MSKPKFHKLQESAFLTDQLLRFELKPHTWLEAFPYIGGKRNILNTQCLLQWVGSIYARHAKLGVPKLAPEHGYFGPRWNEDATLIHGDLDDLLITELIPELVASCKGGVFACYTFPLILLRLGAGVDSVLEVSLGKGIRTTQRRMPEIASYRFLLLAE
jgi:hypothetical protein